MRFNKRNIWILMAYILPWHFLMVSCDKFLDERSNKSVLIPNKVKDLQALLDNNTTLNLYASPGLLEISTDDYFLESTVYDALTTFEQSLYTWDDYTEYLPTNINLQWKNPYKVIFTANTVLDRLTTMESETTAYRDVKGMALFLRGFTFYQLAQVYCPPYRIQDEEYNRKSPGLPLRLTPDFEEKSIRSTLQETYDRILSDIEESAKLLQDETEYSTRPAKTAAYAALARIYLCMGRYEDALANAQKSLDINSTLMDYGSPSKTSTTPFEALNPETLFFAYTTSISALNPNRASVDTSLYALYSDDDHRKTLFFNKKANGYYAFKGNYAGFYNQSFFSGLARDELYLIKAECLARKEDLQEAKEVLKTLLDTRFVNGFEFPSTIQSKGQLLSYILTERRKELLFRGVRWSDLRRLNQEEGHAKVITRKFNKNGDIEMFSLPPNDLRYTMLLPQEVVRITGMQQNLR